MTQRENKAFEREQIKDMLELEAVPKAVDDRLRELYAGLPDTMPAADTAGSGSRRGVFCTTSRSLLSRSYISSGERVEYSLAVRLLFEGLPGLSGSVDPSVLSSGTV